MVVEELFQVPLVSQGTKLLGAQGVAQVTGASGQAGLVQATPSRTESGSDLHPVGSHCRTSGVDKCSEGCQIPGPLLS